MNSDNPFKYRIRLCFFLFALFFLSLFVRAFFLQVIPDAKIKKLKETQEAGTVSIPSPRGTIYDRNGRALAVSIEATSVYADPSVYSASTRQQANLAKLLGITDWALRQKVKNKDRRFVWLGRKLSKQTANKIQQLAIPGIYSISEWDRFYPDRESASQIIGLVGMEGNGLEGIEKFYDDFLYSVPTVLKMTKDAKGRSIEANTRLFQEGRRGVDVYLTIDSTIQYLLDRELITNAIQHKVKQAMGLVMNPKTGEILAMSSFPQANPNDIHGAEDVIALRNLNVLDVFEPGSILKVFIMAGALEDRIIKPNEVFDCRESSLKIGSRTFKNPVDKDWLTPKDILKYSNNVGIARIGLRMGRDRLLETLEKFGFGSKTGIDFPGEGPGIFQKDGKWHDMRMANISFGQGIAVTPVQLAKALSMIANGGFRVQPHLVRKIDLQSDGEISYEPHDEFTRPLFDRKTIETIQKWMQSVTEEDGTGFRGKIPGYRTAGKTGTAQIFDFQSKQYSHEELVASFFGFAPATQPKLVSLIVYRQPTGSGYGGEIAAPVFRKVMEQSLHYLDVPYDDGMDESKMEFVKAPKINYNDNSDQMPNLKGLPMRDAVEISRRISPSVEINGTGRVYKQYPEQGESLQNRKIQLYLRNDV